MENKFSVNDEVIVGFIGRTTRAYEINGKTYYRVEDEGTYAESIEENHITPVPQPEDFENA